MSTIGKYMSLVKFSHTVFALPFALVGFTYAVAVEGYPFGWGLLLKVLLCMVLARNAAMGFNRWADRKSDAANPRTAGRDIPAGRITPRAAAVFTIVNAAGFIAAAAWINKLTMILAPVALFVVLGYSLTKRFTALSHIVLGCALAIAPVGAYIAVTGGLAVVPILLAGTVLTWTAGFDILYSMQDAEFDRRNGLKSIPARFSPGTSNGISIFLHLISAYGVIVTGTYYGGGRLYWIGAWSFILLLAIQHIFIRPGKIYRLSTWFGSLNGISSLIYAAFAIADMINRY